MTMHQKSRKSVIFTFILLGFFTGSSSWAFAEIHIVKAARMLDVTNGKMLNNVVVVVEDGIITSLNPQSFDQQAHVIDLGNTTLLPGLIDSHVHLTSSGEDFRPQILTENAAEAALRGVESARVTLMAGFTTVRDLAQLIPSKTLIAVALSAASDKDWIAAPRIITAGHALSITGGQIDPSMWVETSEGLMALDTDNGIADNAQELIKATRFQIKHGAKVIKIAVTGVVSSSGQFGVQQYSEDEIRAVVNEATRNNLRVAAHAVGPAGINAAVKAGVASIEHGFMVNAENLRHMKKRGTYLVPTTRVASMVAHGSDFTKTDLGAVVRAGVKVAMGSDASVTAHGSNAKEIETMVAFGLTPLQAIQAATINAAGLLGKDDRGRIAPGLLADIIAVEGNPLEGIEQLSKVVFVMKGGKVYKNTSQTK